MKLSLPILTVIDRRVPYAYSRIEVPIPKADAPRVPDAAQRDFLQLQASLPGPDGDRARGRLDRIVQVDVGSRFVAAPGDPSPFVWRDVGAVDCGTLSGMAAVYCAVMAYR